MAVVRIIAAAVLAFALSGCQALKDDPMIGDHPWQPGSSKAPNAR